LLGRVVGEGTEITLMSHKPVTLKEMFRNFSVSINASEFFCLYHPALSYKVATNHMLLVQLTYILSAKYTPDLKDVVLKSIFKNRNLINNFISIAC
jgi:hypothetical protein